MRAAVPDHHVKCIVDPRRVVRPLVVGHHFECVPGEVVVDENGEPVSGPFHPRPSADILRINHYLTKSRTEMIERRQGIQVNTGKVSSLSLDQWCALEASWIQLRDPIAARYGDRVRAAARDPARGINPSAFAGAGDAPRLR
jgi:hypothetical protein